MKLSVSEINSSEITQLVDLFFDESVDTNDFFTQFRNKEEMLKELNSAVNDKYFLIKQGKIINGYASLRGLDDGYVNPRFGIYIFSSFRNRGIAKLATKLILNTCKNQYKFNKVDLKVHKDNFKAFALYESLGFIVYKEIEDSLLMEIDL